MKECVLKGNTKSIGEIFDFGWQYKKKLAKEVTNPFIEKIYKSAKNAGATGGKLSGAGGGGFMMFYCPGNSRYNVINELLEIGGEIRRFQFTKYGLTTWSI